MTFWEVINFLCLLPLGIAKMCGSVILGMAAFMGCSFIGWCIWNMIFADKTPSIFTRKWEDE